MIGSYVKGIDTTTGKTCEGIIIDTIITALGIGLGDPRAIGKAQTLPMPLTAYLVLSPVNTIHIVAPHQISNIDLMPESKDPLADYAENAANDIHAKYLSDKRNRGRL